jgi:hypothetical protein
MDSALTVVNAADDSADQYEFQSALYKDSELAAQILVTDGNDNLTAINYVLATDGTIAIPKSAFNAGKVLVRFAEITDYQLSAWSQQYQLSSDGVLSAMETTPVKAARLSVEKARMQWQMDLEEERQQAALLYQEDLDAADADDEADSAEKTDAAEQSDSAEKTDAAEQSDNTEKTEKSTETDIPEGAEQTEEVQSAQTDETKETQKETETKETDAKAETETKTQDNTADGEITGGQ